MVSESIGFPLTFHSIIVVSLTTPSSQNFSHSLQTLQEFLWQDKGCGVGRSVQIYFTWKYFIYGSYLLVTCASDDWKEELQKYVAPDQLPQAYGGTRCEPDPCCSDYVSWRLTNYCVAVCSVVMIHKYIADHDQPICVCFNNWKLLLLNWLGSMWGTALMENGYTHIYNSMHALWSILSWHSSS